MNYSLRKATADDFPAINALFCEMMYSIYGKTDASYVEETMQRYFSDGEDWICVAESEGKIIAFLSMEAHREEEPFVYFDDLSVSAALRGQGIGSALMDEGEKYARSLGFPAVVLHVETSNINARRLYERRGFSLHHMTGTRRCMHKQLK